MSATLASSLTLWVDATLSNALDLATAAVPLAYRKNHTWTSGTDAAQANQVFHDQRTLSASATEDLDLAGGLTDAYGTTLTFTKIRALIVQAAAANTNNVLVGGAAAAQFATWVSDATDKIVVRPGGTLALIAPDATGYAVTATTGDILRIANSAGTTSVTYDLILIGCV